MSASNLPYVIDSQAGVLDVWNHRSGNADILTVENGDKVVYKKYTPKEDDPEVGISKGSTYNVFLVTKRDKTQAFIRWSPDDPNVQFALESTYTEVRGIGVPGPNTLKKGDLVKITGSAEAGVTFDVYRGNRAVGTFSFPGKE